MENESKSCGFCLKSASVKCANCKEVYYCDRSCQKRHWKQHKKACLTRSVEDEKALIEPLEAVDVSNLSLKVEVRTKAGGSLGVFATEDVQKGEWICFYDGITKDANTKVRLRRIPESGTIAIVDAEQVFKQVLDDVKCLAHPSKQGFVKIAAENKNGFGIGQWIGDYTKPDLAQVDDNFGRATEELHRYQDLSLKHANCQVDDTFWFKSTAAIAKGSEVLVHYGFMYWLKKMMLEETRPAKRLFLYSLNDQATQIFNLQKFYEFDDATCLAFMKVLVQMPSEELDRHPNIKELIFDLTMKNVDISLAK